MVCVEENLGLVNSIVKKNFTDKIGTTYDYEDLFQLGCVGLVKAAQRFDETKGYKFSTYASSLISGEILTHSRDHECTIKMPRSFRKKVMDARKAKRIIEEKGEKVTTGKIAKEAKLSKEEVTEAIEFKDPISLNVIRNGFTDTKDIEIQESIFDEQQQEEKIIERLFVDEALNKLPKRQKEVIRYRYFECLSQAKTAKKIGISQSQIFRDEKEALATLKAYFLKCKEEGEEIYGY